MPPDRDLFDESANDELTAESASLLSEWLAGQDVVHLAIFARAARLSGSSFMTHVLGSD